MLPDKKGLHRLIWVLFVGAFSWLIFLQGSQPASSRATHDSLTKADVDRMMEELSNWGRWGKEDQLGAINLITPAKRLRAARLVQEGVSVSLARLVEKEEAADNPFPFGHKMLSTGLNNTAQFAVDTYTVSYHGHAHTHMDSLGHMFYRGKMYNGISRKEITEAGAQKLGISNVKTGIFTRGILVDLPRLKGVPYLEPGTPIYAEDLEAWEEKTGIKVGAGDALLIRTGRWKRRDLHGPWNVEEKAAGLHVSSTAWLHKRDIAILGSEDASDVSPSRIEGLTRPVHQVMLIAVGVHILDCLDLEALSEAAQERNRWEFLLTAAPLAVSGGTGSPLNPIATF